VVLAAVVALVAVQPRRRPLPSTISTNAWKTYTDTSGNVRFRYPPDWRPQLKEGFGGPGSRLVTWSRLGSRSRPRSSQASATVRAALPSAADGADSGGGSWPAAAAGQGQSASVTVEGDLPPDGRQRFSGSWVIGGALVWHFIWDEWCNRGLPKATLRVTADGGASLTVPGLNPKSPHPLASHALHGPRPALGHRRLAMSRLRHLVGDVEAKAYRSIASATRPLGHGRLALGVGLDNPGAAGLRAPRLRRLGHGTVLGTWEEHAHVDQDPAQAGGPTVGPAAPGRTLQAAVGQRLGDPEGSLAAAPTVGPRSARAAGRRGAPRPTPPAVPTRPCGGGR
jgi:hypothetical protein